MSCCFQIERLILPRQFLFDSLRLYAKFQSTAVDLLAIRFDLTQSTTERNIPLNVQLKVPSVRSKFTLVLQIRIINMRIPPSEINVDLSTSLPKIEKDKASLSQPGAAAYVQMTLHNLLFLFK